MRFALSLLVFTALCPAALGPAVATAAGLASGNNFSVITPATPTQVAGDQYAQLVLNRAETFREQFIQEWLDRDLPQGDVRTVISVSFSKTENSGMTLARENPTQRFHNVFLSSTAENASGAMLNHEVVHTVLATAYPYPNRLPPWAEEGIASRYDSQRLIGVREQEVRSWIRKGRVPQIAGILATTDIKSFDDTGYAAAESLVAYLLTLSDKQTVLRFADEGQRSGWDSALRNYYQVSDVGQLQRDWRAWLVASAQ